MAEEPNPSCEICGGSGVESVYGGHGTVLEIQCSMCSAAAESCAADEDFDSDEPDDYDCDHAGYDADILTGEAWCWRCQHKWIMTSDEITREIEHQAEYMSQQAED